jgi:nucleoside-diphosphate-sugar epimerase
MGRRILITGAVGQVGTDLVPALRARYGSERVVAAGYRTQPSDALRRSGPFVSVDTTDRQALAAVLREHSIGTAYHLASVLSGTGEVDPNHAWLTNVGSLKNLLDLAVEQEIERVFWPSSIAVFGPTTPRQQTPQHTVLEPTTMYGVTKVTGENLCTCRQTPCCNLLERPTIIFEDRNATLEGLQLFHVELSPAKRSRVSRRRAAGLSRPSE